MGSNQRQPQDILPLKVGWQSYRVPGGQAAFAGMTVLRSDSAASAKSKCFIEIPFPRQDGAGATLTAKLEVAIHAALHALMHLRGFRIERGRIPATPAG